MSDWGAIVDVRPAGAEKRPTADRRSKLLTYEALLRHGAQTARELAGRSGLTDVAVRDALRALRWDREAHELEGVWRLGRGPARQPTPKPVPIPPKPQAPKPAPQGTPRWRIWSALWREGGAQTTHLAAELRLPQPVVLQHLTGLERDGAATRTGRTRATRWWPLVFAGYLGHEPLEVLLDHVRTLTATTPPEV